MAQIEKLRKHKPKDLLIPYRIIYSTHSDKNNLHTRYMAAINHIAVQTMLYKLSNLNVIPRDYYIECIIENPYSLYLRGAVYPKRYRSYDNYNVNNINFYNDNF